MPAYSELIDELLQTIVGWVEIFFAMLPNLVVAILVLVVFWLFSGPSHRMAHRTLDRVSHNKEINQLLSTIIRLFVIGVGLFIALGILKLDKTVTSLLAGVGVVGLALGFAFQDLAANLISGIMLSVQRPFRIGDVIEAGGERGIVEGTSLRSTNLRRFSGPHVIVPNKNLFQSPLINFSRAGRRRLELKVGVAYSSDLREVERLTRQVLEGLPGRMQEPGVEVFFTEFAGSSIDLVAYFWVELGTIDMQRLMSEAIIAIKDAYDDAGISIPFPVQTMDIGSDLLERLLTKKDSPTDA